VTGIFNWGTALLASVLLAQNDNLSTRVEEPSSTTVIGLLAGFALFAAVVLTIMFVVSRALRVLRTGADRFARGDLSQPVMVDGPLQVASLAESLNTMAQQLDERLRTVIEQRNLQDAVFSSMAEGVIAVDQNERILNINQAAADMLQTKVDKAWGRPIQEISREPGIHDLISTLLSSDQSVEAELTMNRPVTGRHGVRYEQIHVQAQATLLRDASGRRIGGLIMLHDVTHLLRLEAVRRDFVANVSHELKTPISTIKAAAETMLDTNEDSGAGDGGMPPFVSIIARQADRLHSIVEDLLTLARLEQDAEHSSVDTEDISVCSVIRNAIETCQPKAQAKDVVVELHCDDHLVGRINSNLLEQAVVNLIDNAVKYSPAKGVVLVDCEKQSDRIAIHVTDHGPGIEAEYLPRLFERFFRTDKARSRELGGTGLGLAIVKHVAQVHKGLATVDSTPGQGSTFTVYLPLPGEELAEPQNSPAD